MYLFGFLQIHRTFSMKSVKCYRLQVRQILILLPRVHKISFKENILLSCYHEKRFGSNLETQIMYFSSIYIFHIYKTNGSTLS